ncbi:stage II sporulation protein M [Proteinivorax hydrogeniformans]|uniref:Stage II sporulation protein M n=1 Tax=Proteinivorax hydrogeniformans TaxID=1826727 RepID=A0AAU8HRF5_9FIRM
MLVEIYKRQWELFKKHYAKPTALIALISIVIAFFSFFVLMVFQDLLIEITDELFMHFEELGVNPNTSHSDLFLIVLVNNLRVSAFMVLLGFIPIIVLPAVSGVVTSISVSMILALFNTFDLYPVQTLIYGILPHGIIELFAIYLAGGIGVFLSLNMFKKIFSSKRAEINIGIIIKDSIISYLIVVAPLIILAAVIEGFVTPVLIDNFHPSL